MSAPINGFGTRQRIALDRPNFFDPRVNGFIANDPHTKQIVTVADPTWGGAQPTGTPGRARAKNKHFQFATILTVDMDSPPVWHAHCSFLDPIDDHLVPRERWSEWMVVHAMQAVYSLLPPWKVDEKDKIQLDKRKYSLHMRLPVSPLEKAMLDVRGMTPPLGPVIKDPGWNLLPGELDEKKP